MGRRKGSLNKNKDEKKVVFKRGRGRPRKPREVLEPEQPSNVKKSKFLGHCPKCDSIVVSLDLETKFIYICTGCGNRARISTLQKERKSEQVSRKDYLETTINADYHDMPAMNDIDFSTDLKIMDT